VDGGIIALEDDMSDARNVGRAAGNRNRGPRRRRQRVHRPGILLHAVLKSRLVHAYVDRRICELRFPDPATGRRVSLAVSYARTGADLVVLAGGRPAGQLWRAFSMPYPVLVLLDRRWQQGLGHLVWPDKPGWGDARRVYRARFPVTAVGDAARFVVITLRPGGHADPHDRSAARRLAASASG
jgi:hypothetical protein